MSMVRCPNQHYYDDSKYSECPYCGVRLSGTAQIGGAGGDVSRTQTVAHAYADDDQKTQRKAPEKEGNTVAKGRGDDSRTIAIHEEALGGNPVCGWLVCRSGGDRGRDYRLYPGNNRAGRGAAMDIRIQGDGTVSAEKHFMLIYDPMHNEFLIAPGSGAVTHVNGELLDAPKHLGDYDVIKAGETELVFVPYCKGEVKW